MATAHLKSHKLPQSKGKVQFKIEVKGEINFTAFVARQQVNYYLQMNVGNLLFAGEPEVIVGEGLLQWDVPVVYALPDLGKLGVVGRFLVDAQSGDLKINESTSTEEMQAHAKRLYRQKQHCIFKKDCVSPDVAIVQCF